MVSITFYNTTDNTFHVNELTRRAIKQLVTQLCTASIWVGILLTLVITSILLSTKKQRKGPIFSLETISFVLAILYNFLNQLQVFWEYENLLMMPDENVKSRREGHFYIISITLEHWIPLLANFAVLFKIVSFYPTQVYSTRRSWLRIFPPSVLIAPRLLLVLLITYEATLVWKNANILIGFEEEPGLNKAALHRYNEIATLDYALQAAFCFYASCILLYKTVETYKILKRSRQLSVRRHIRFLVDAVFMTYWLLCPLAVACAVEMNSKNQTEFEYLATNLVNVSVVCSLLAASWSNISNHDIPVESVVSRDIPLPLIGELCRTTTSDEASIQVSMPLRKDDQANPSHGCLAKSQTAATQQQPIDTQID